MISAIDLQVALVALVCLVAGGGLAVLTWWFWQSAQPESPALGPLEMMSERRYERASDEERARILEAARIDPQSVTPLTRRHAKADRRDDEFDDESESPDDFVDDWTDLGPIDPLLR